LLWLSSLDKVMNAGHSAVLSEEAPNQVNVGNANHSFITPLIIVSTELDCINV
jgi:hypothetical protein